MRSDVKFKICYNFHNARQLIGMCLDDIAIALRICKCGIDYGNERIGMF